MRQSLKRVKKQGGVLWSLRWDRGSCVKIKLHMVNRGQNRDCTDHLGQAIWKFCMGTQESLEAFKYVCVCFRVSWQWLCLGIRKCWLNWKHKRIKSGNPLGMIIAVPTKINDVSADSEG